MRFVDRSYPDIVRDLLTVLTGGTTGEVIVLPDAVPGVVRLENPPVRRISHLEGEIQVGDRRLPYRFTERDFELVGTEEDPDALVALRFRAHGRRPAPGSSLTVNYYPSRLRPTPLNDVNVGSVVRTLLETIARELATQYEQLRIVYDSAFIETARDASLDRVAALVDARRLRRGHPVGKVRLSRRPGSPGGVFVPSNTAVSDGLGNRYLTTHDAQLQPSQPSTEVWVHGESPRTAVVEAGRLSVLERAISGVDRVVNDEPTWLATEEEGDAPFASRARRAIHAAGRGTRDALKFGLESLPFVTAVTLTEYGDPANVDSGHALVPLPGMLRIDVALSQDDVQKRNAVDRTIRELRPAGVHVERAWAAPVTIGLAVDLVLAGTPQPTSVVEEVKAGVTARLVEYVLGLGPGATLRRSRLLSAAMQDPRVADATVRATAGGIAITTDAHTLPADRAAAVDGLTPVTFAVRAEVASVATGPVQVFADVDAGVRESTLPVAALEERIRAVLGPVFASLSPVPPYDSLAFDRVAEALRDPGALLIDRAGTVVSFEEEGGGFVDLRDGDAPWRVPARGSVTLRAVRARKEEE